MNTIMSYLNKEVYVGIDVHKASYSITAVCDKKVVKSATVKANPDAWPGALLVGFPMQRKSTRFMSLGFRAMSFIVNWKLPGLGTLLSKLPEIQDPAPLQSL